MELTCKFGHLLTVWQKQYLDLCVLFLLVFHFFFLHNKKTQRALNYFSFLMKAQVEWSMYVANCNDMGDFGEGRAPTGGFKLCVLELRNTLRNLIKVNTSQKYDYSQQKHFK